MAGRSNIYRRFVLKDKNKEKALLSLIEQKRLTPDDLMLILSTIKINSSFEDNSQFWHSED